MKLKEKQRVGSRLRRTYDKPQTPFERVKASGQGDAGKIAALQRLRDALDPFELNQVVLKKLERITRLANRRQSPKPGVPSNGNGRAGLHSPCLNDTLQSYILRWLDGGVQAVRGVPPPPN